MVSVEAINKTFWSMLFASLFQHFHHVVHSRVDFVLKLVIFQSLDDNSPHLLYGIRVFLNFLIYTGFVGLF